MQKNENYFTKIFNICWCVVWICALAMRLRISNKRGIVSADLNICISMCLKGPNPTASLFTTFLTEIEFIQNPTHLIYFFMIRLFFFSLYFFQELNFYLNIFFLWFFFSVVTHICTGPNRRRHWTGCFGLIWGSIHRNVLQPLTALMLTNAYFWTLRFPGQGIWKKCHWARKCSELGAESGRTSITRYICFAN